jgi:hypothetical protein
MRPANAMAMLVCHSTQKPSIAAPVAVSNSTGNGIAGYPDF